MTLVQLWRFLYDIRVAPQLLPVAMIDRILVAMRRQHFVEIEENVSGNRQGRQTVVTTRGGTMLISSKCLAPEREAISQ